MSDDTGIISEFESLGDNCEFGFVQRHHGLEPGGLLRWASSTFDGLIRALGCRFAGIYRLEDLAPHTHNMVIDRKYGIAFHSMMRSAPNGRRLEYSVTGEALEALHREEFEKVSYLVAKLIDGLTVGKKIFVYKRNAGLHSRQLRKLRGALDSYGNSRLLCVVPGKYWSRRGTIKSVAKLTKLAVIEELAPYDNVEAALYDQWTAICRQVHAQPWD